MTEIDKAIAWLEEQESAYLEDGDTDEAGYLGRAVIALRARREKVKRETMLTYAELQEMDNKPVFIQFGTGEQQWAICCVQGERIYFYGPLLENEEPDEAFYNMEHTYSDQEAHFGLHLLGWRAWRQEPKKGKVR